MHPTHPTHHTHHTHASHHGRPSGIRLSPRHERWVSGVALALVLTGALWLIYHYFMTVQGEFGETRNPLEAWWLRLHGAAAMAFLVTLGTLLPIHIQRSWQLRRNHVTGALMIGVVSAMVLSGYGLYYLGSEELRPWLSVIHWGIGLAAIPVLPLHIIRGKRAKAAKARHGASVPDMAAPEAGVR